jgi:hypothetical protein
MTRTDRLEAALSNVEKLLNGRLKASAKKTPAPAAKKASASAPKKPAAPAKKAAKKVSAMAHPNLVKLQRVISHGAITNEEVIGAVVEALRMKRVNTRLAGAIAVVLQEALGTTDVIDMAA